MKIFKFLAVALVAMLGFVACDKHECNDYDHSKDLVGTWTCLQANFAEALVIKADGSALSTGYDGEEYWENMAGNIVVKNGMVTLTFEDGDNFEGHFDIIPGVAFSIYTDEGNRFTFNYCKEDLTEEVVGMWVCHEGLPGVENDMAIFTYSEDGKMTMTTQASAFIPADFVNVVCDYKVVGDIMFKNVPKENTSEGNAFCQPVRLAYTANGTTLGDILIENIFAPYENGVVEITSSWLRIKQNLELPGMKYDYIKTFVTNVKGEDKDIPFLNTSFNFAKMDGSIIDKFLKSTLFSVEFPKANEIKYSFLVDGKINFMSAPIEVEGNKMTIKMSANNPAYHDIDVYTFQDQDNTQMHMYMHTTAFEKFFANTSVHVMLGNGQLDKDDTEAIENVYKTVADAVESINLSLVMTKAK